MEIAIINGPNINVLENRDGYEGKSLADIEDLCRARANLLGSSLEFFQSNHEGYIVEKIQQLSCDGIIINAAAYSHTSVAIMDALLIHNNKSVPIIEVHISNVFARERYRQHSYISRIAKAVISGMGVYGYQFAIEYLCINHST